MKGNIIVFSILVALSSCSLDDKENRFNQSLNDSEEYSKLKLSECVAAYNNMDKKPIDTQIAFSLAKAFYQYDEFIYFNKVSNLVLRQSLHESDTANIAKAYKFVAMSCESLRKFDSAFYFYSKAEKFYKALGDNGSLPLIHNAKAEIQLKKNDLLGAEISALASLHIAKLTKDDEQRFQSYAIIGVTSSKLQNYNKAIEYDRKALSLVDRSNLTEKIYKRCVILNNIGNVYEDLRAFDSSVYNYRKALSHKGLKGSSPELYSTLLDNLGYTLLKTNQYKNVPELLYESLNIRDSLNLIASVHSNIHLSKYYAVIGDTLKSKYFGKNALVKANKFSSKVEIVEGLKQLALIERINGADYLEKALILTDSLILEERKTQNKFARIQYETEEIANERATAVKHKWIIAWSALLMLLIGSLLFIIGMQRAKQKEMMLNYQQQSANEELYTLMLNQQKTIEEVRNKEKQRIGIDLHDGIMNKLASIRLNLFVLNKKCDSVTVKRCLPYIADIQDVEREIRDIAHDLNKDIFSKHDSFAIIIESLINEQKIKSNAVCHLGIDLDIEWHNVNSTIKVNIYRILQESLQNIYKHANASHIVVSIIKQTNKLLIEISDDGCGFNERNSKDGIGLQNIKVRVQSFRGSIEIFSQIGIGTRIKLLIPI